MLSADSIATMIRDGNDNLDENIAEFVYNVAYIWPMSPSTT